MIKKDEQTVMRAVALCFKPYLKPEEALIYCNLGRTQFAKKCEEYFVFKSSNGYFKKEDLDKMMAGQVAGSSENLKLRLGLKRRNSR